MPHRVVSTLLLIVCAMSGASVLATEPMEFIRVSPDGWNFETAHSHKRFIPFGANLIAHDPANSIGQTLDILTKPQWEPVKLRKMFEGARAANLNLMKVFLPSNQVIPDPQTNDTITFATMTPPFFERLDTLFQIARDTGVYISLTFSEWGMHANRWFQDGGIFFGRHPDDGPGIDSFAVYRNFWKAVAARYKNEPALFSYNLATEYYIANSNWWAHKIDPVDPNKYWYLFNDTWGLPNWHRWLLAEYGSLAAVNAAWGTAYAKIDDIPQTEIVWAGSAYTNPQQMVADFNSFKEWVTYRLLRNQADAIRSVDPGHMIACGRHPHHPAIGWSSSAVYHAGIAPKEMDFLDYTSIHLYTHPADGKPNQGPYTDALHVAIMTARFSHHPCKPVIAEEFGHNVMDYQESLTETTNMLKALVGHVSGFQVWFLGEAAGYYGPLDENYALNDWGREWKKLAEPGGVVATLPLARTPAATTFKLERLNGMAPIEQTQLVQVMWNWNGYQHPVEFDWPLNPSVAKIRPAVVHTGVTPLRWDRY